MQDILTRKNSDLNEYILEYKIDADETETLLRLLSVLGVSAATVFPDLDHLAMELTSNLGSFPDRPEINADSCDVDSGVEGSF